MSGNFTGIKLYFCGMSKGHGFDLVAFGAHPDDVELFAGGTLAKSVAQGLRVAIVDLTRGELGTRGTAETRKAEAAAAQGILGVEHRDCGLLEVHGAQLPLRQPQRAALVALMQLVDAHRQHEGAAWAEAARRARHRRVEKCD